MKNTVWQNGYTKEQRGILKGQTTLKRVLGQSPIVPIENKKQNAGQESEAILDTGLDAKRNNIYNGGSPGYATSTRPLASASLRQAALFFSTPQSHSLFIRLIGVSVLKRGKIMTKEIRAAITFPVTALYLQ